MSETAFLNDELPLSEKFIQAREKQNLTLEEAAEHLNLSLEQLTKLESSELDFAKTTTFERGYIRNYAQYLEVDITYFESSFPDVNQVGSELKSMSRFKYPAPKPFFRSGLGKVVLVICFIAVIAFGFNFLKL